MIVLLRNARFHSYVLRTAESQTSDALGAQVRAQSFGVRLSGLSPTLDLYGIVVNGAQPHFAPPLLQVEHARVGVRVLSLLRRKWYLSEVEIQRPVIRVFVDKNGSTNLPTPKTTYNTSIFDLAIRHAVLDGGELYYNDQKSALSADVRDLNLRAAYDSAQNQYSGQLAYSNGHIKAQQYAPMPHDLQASFAATPGRFTLQDATLRSGRTQLKMAATVDGYAAPRVEARYEAIIDAGEFRSILKNNSVPVGLIHASGTLRYSTVPGTPALNATAAEGTITSSQLQLMMPSFRAEVRNIAARYSLTDGNLDVRDLRALVFGGQLSGAASVRDVAKDARSKVHASLRGVSLQELTAATSVSLKEVALLGSADAEIDATGTKSLKDVEATGDVSGEARIAPRSGGNVLPLSVVAHGKYSARGEQVTLTDTLIRTPQSSIQLDGTASTRSAMKVQVHSNDLHEVETIAAIFQPPKPGAQPLGLHGRADFTGWIRGSTSAPQITGQLNAADFQFKGSNWRVLRASVMAGPAQVSLQNGLLAPQRRGRIGFALTAGMRDWAVGENSPFALTLDISKVDVAELVKAAGSQTSISGTLDGNARLSGTQLNPVGQGKFELTKSAFGPEAFEASANFNGTGDTVHATLALHMPSGAAQADATYHPKQRTYEAQLRANGIHIEKLHAVQLRRLGLAGVVNLNASGRGTLDNPGLQATVEIPSLQLKDQTISNLVLKADVANHLAKVALDSDVVHSHVKGQGTIALTGDYNADIAFNTERIPLEPLVDAYAPSHAGSITGVTELHATVRGPLKNKALVEAHATIPQLAINYGNAVQLNAPSPIHIDYTNGVLNLQRAALRGTGTDLQFQGSVPIVDRSAPMSVLLLGTVDLRLAQLFDPDITSSGQLRFDINSYGNTDNPDVQGQVKIINASLAIADAPLGLQSGNGVLTLTRDRLLVSEFRGKVGGGTIAASGGVLYRPSLRFDLALRGNGIRMLYPQGVRSGMDATLALSGTTEDARLQGTVNVDQLSLTPDLDLARLVGQFGGTSSVPPTQGFSNNLQLQLAVRSTSGINLVSRELSLQGAANLNVRGTAAEPIILGRINLTGGDLIFRRNRYILQGGTIAFTNPARTQPSLNVNVTTTVQQYNIAMRFEGPVERLRTSYTSDPSLPPSDIINLLAFGETTESAAANPNPPGSLAAESAIASAVSGQVTSRVERLAGISHLSIDPTLGQNNINPGATLTLQQRVTGKLFVTFSTDVTSTQNQVIQLQYQQSPRLSFSSTRDQNGGFAFDVRIRREW